MVNQVEVVERPDGFLWVGLRFWRAVPRAFSAICNLGIWLQGLSVFAQQLDAFMKQRPELDAERVEFGDIVGREQLFE